MRICTCCKTEKDKTEFYHEKRVKDGLQSVCKECRNKNKRSKYVKKDIKNLKHRKDLTNQKFGKLTVIKFEIITNGPNSCSGKWLCECECGKSTHVLTHMLTLGDVTSCGCLRYERCGKLNNKWTGHEEISGSHFKSIKRGAISRNLEFSITIEYLWELFLKQDKKCSISGMPLIMKDVKKRTKTKTASLDRIDSSKGYTKDNVQWVHRDINMMKNSFNQEYFISVCKLISNNQTKEVEG